MSAEVQLRRFSPLLICIVLVGVFAGTVGERQVDAGVLSYGHHEWLTAHSLKFSRIWWREGVFSLHFLMMETPRDIEHPSLDSMQVYPSYPPGAALLPFAVAVVRGVEPTVGSVMEVNLALHLLVALCLSLGMWLWLPRQSPWLEIVAALIPGVGYLLLPGPMFWQQNVYFTDTAVMGPFAVVLLAIAMEARFSKRVVEGLLGIAFFWGFLTDWFFISVAVVLMSARLVGLWATRRLTVRSLSLESASFALPFALAFGLYGWQLTKHSLWSSWRAKLFLRTFSDGDGATSISADFNEIFWGYVRVQYSGWGIAFAVTSGVFALFYLARSFSLNRRGSVEPDGFWCVPHATFVAVAALAPLLHTYLLKNHSYLHDFSALKFAVVICCVPFVVLPQCLVELIRGSVRIRAAVLVSGVVFGGLYFATLHGRYRDFVPPRNPEIARMGFFVGGNTGFNDVVFSSMVKAEPYPGEPHLLAHSLKLIHQVETLSELSARVELLPPQASVVWFGDTSRAVDPIGGAELWAGAQRVSDGSLFLVRLSRESFLHRVSAVP